MISKLFLAISSFFFRLAMKTHRQRPTVPLHYLKPLQRTTFGIFFEIHVLHGKSWALFGNPQIGFFYKDAVCQDEVVGFPYHEIATADQLGDLGRYLANKISELESQRDTVTYAVQRHQKIEQSIPKTGGEAVSPAP